MTKPRKADEAKALEKQFPPVVPAPTPKQEARIAKARENFAKRGARYAVLSEHKEAGTTAKVCSPHTDLEGQRVHELDVFGTTSKVFADRLFGELGWVVGTTAGVLDQTAINAALAVMDGAEPQNEIEAMLVAQMAATHSVAIFILGRAKFASTVPAMQEYGTLATKLLRTYAAQVEALAKLRRGGEQRVIVEHVHVRR